MSIQWKARIEGLQKAVPLVGIFKTTILQAVLNPKSLERRLDGW